MKLLFPLLQLCSKRFFSWVLALFLVLLSGLYSPVALATGVADLPELDPTHPTWVLDQADVLSLSSQAKLDKTLSRLAKETGQEVRLVSVRRLDYGETPDSLVEKLFDKWFPTPAEQANQVLVLLDSVTNGTAIHTGESIKTVLPDEVANSIAQETMRFPLREENYNQAFVDASDRLVAILTGQPDPGPPEIRTVEVEGNYKTAAETDDRTATFVVIGLLIAATVIPMVTYFIYQGSS
uniref:TPM domain-containing protein n=1 Tax=Cyanothece sp. (strain PCC 7425 / ATCC 29141) TaxID=395961 RepID=B8HYP1_CYAP4